MYIAMTLTTIAIIAVSVALLLRGRKRTYAFDEIVEDEARAQNAPARIVQAIIQVESGGNPQAIGAVGEIGLMQLMPTTAAQMGYRGSRSGLFDPRTNIHYGTKYLAWQMKRYRELSAAISAYNSGTAVKLPGGKFKNQSYVDKVLRFAEV